MWKFVWIRICWKFETSNYFLAEGRRFEYSSLLPYCSFFTFYEFVYKIDWIWNINFFWSILFLSGLIDTFVCMKWQILQKLNLLLFLYHKWVKLNWLNNTSSKIWTTILPFSRLVSFLLLFIVGKALTSSVIILLFLRLLNCKTCQCSSL